MDWRILGAIGGLVAIVTVVFVPRRIAARNLFGDNHAARLGVENEVRRTIIQMLGGSFVLVSVFFTYETVRISQQSLALAERGQVTERFTRAIDQMGSDQIDVATGGIYALGQLARESKTEHSQVMEILVAFIHRHSSQDAFADCPGVSPTVPADVQAALTVIGERNTTFDPPGTVIDLGQLDLSGADFSRGNYDEVDFRGSCLYQAAFDGASLRGADFSTLYLTNGGAQRLAGTDLTDATFRGADAQEARFAGTVMLNVTMTEADLSEGDLSNAVFGDSGGANLGIANLRGVDLSGANLEGADLAGADLRGADLGGAIVTSRQLGHADTDESTILP